MTQEISPPRIILIRLSAIGDVVLTLPIPAAIKQYYPRARVDLLVREDLAPLADSAPFDKVIPFSKSKHRGLVGLKQLVADLGNDYTHVIDLHHVIRTMIIMRRIKSPRKSHYVKQSFRRYSLIWLRFNFFNKPSHVTERYRRALVRAGLDIPHIEHRIELPFIQMGYSDEIRQSWNVVGGSPVVGIMAGAARVNRQWFRERFARVADDLVSLYGARIILFGGPSDEHTNHLIAQMMVATPLDLAGKVPLSHLPSAIAALDLLITNETGLMHLGYILNVPMISIFGPASSDFGFAPRRPGSIIFEHDLPCRPCSIHGEGPCLNRTLDCLKRTTTTMVTRASQILLHRSGFRPLEFPEELR
jgi:heptosyltransferase-2